jgi:hypothetical protein
MGRDENSSPKRFPRNYEIVVRTGKRVNSKGNEEAYSDHATVSIYLNGSRAYELSIPHSPDIAPRVRSVTEALELTLQWEDRGLALEKRLMAFKGMRKVV